MWVMSSRLMMAFILRANSYSSALVSLEENMISSPVKPTACANISSGMEAQSTPQPSSFRSLRM